MSSALYHIPTPCIRQASVSFFLWRRSCRVEWHGSSFQGQDAWIFSVLPVLITVLPVPRLSRFPVTVDAALKVLLTVRYNELGHGSAAGRGSYWKGFLDVFHLWKDGSWQTAFVKARSGRALMELKDRRGLVRSLDSQWLGSSRVAECRVR